MHSWTGKLQHYISKTENLIQFSILTVVRKVSLTETNVKENWDFVVFLYSKDEWISYILDMLGDVIKSHSDKLFLYGIISFLCSLILVPFKLSFWHSRRNYESCNKYVSASDWKNITDKTVWKAA